MAPMMGAGEMPVQCPDPLAASFLPPTEPRPRGCYSEWGGENSSCSQTSSATSQSCQNRAGPGLSPDSRLNWRVTTQYKEPAPRVSAGMVDGQTDLGFGMYHTPYAIQQHAS